MTVKEMVLKRGWKILKFSECIEHINTGLNPRKNFTLGTGDIKYITAKNLTKFGTVDFSKCDFIDERAKSIIHRRSNIEVGDILFSSRAPIGHCHLIKNEPNDFDIGESIFAIRVNREVVLPAYMCLYLASDYYVEAASLHTTGSIIVEIRIGDLMNTEIIVPPMEIQNKIADCLERIDRNLELNRMINDNLQHQLKLMYDYWFTQFDFPDENGKPYRASGGAMVWNEQLKRDIPSGWQVKAIGDLITFDRGISYSTKTISDKGTPMVNLASFTPIGEYKPEGIKYYTGEYSLEKILSPFDLVMCNTQQTAIDYKKDIIGRSLLIPDIFDGDIVSSHHVTQIKPYNKLLKCYLHYLFNTDYFHKYIASHTNGTNILGLLFYGVEEFCIPIPDDDTLGKFDTLVLNSEKIKSTILKENQVLISLRDWLLPMLMNGQATISD